MRSSSRSLLLPLCVLLALPRFVWAQQDDYAAGVMAGLSNAGRNPGEPYVTAGDRAYLIGTQDGNFPDLGGHVPGEMAGLWTHPIKLIDGFRATITDSASGQAAGLTRSTEFINYPFGNRLRYGTVLNGLEVDRLQFSPDGYPGVIVQYILRNTGDRPKQLSVELSVKTDLLPVWFSDQLGIRDARDTVAWQPRTSRYLARDTRHPWFVVWGTATSARARPVSGPVSAADTGNGVTAASRHTVMVAAHDTGALTFIFAGSTTTRRAADLVFDRLARRHDTLLRAKQTRYAALIDRARISIPDPRLQQVYDWVRINAEWLVRDVPGIGRGLSAGLMEYPWWFGTETYSLEALLATGDTELARQTLRLLRAVSAKANGNGRIVHEVTTNGGISNPGNTQETARFIIAVRDVVRWTGSLTFAREMYPAMKQGLHWLLTDKDRNGDLFPEGYGITEVLGLNTEVIDVAAATQPALVATADIGDILGDGASSRYRRLAAELKRRINQRFWLDEDSSYADFYGTRADAVNTAEGAAKQIGLPGADKLTGRDQELIRYYDRLRDEFAATPDTTKAWMTNRNLVVITPMEMGIAPRDLALRGLDQLRRHGVGEYGPYLSAVDRQAMMTIATGVAAVAEANYGRTDDALWYVDKIVQTFNRKLPGSISEMMPDDGCFVIAWTMYGIVLPLVEHVFGVAPDAVHKTVIFEPHLPKGWEELSIHDLHVGGNRISFSRSKTAKGVQYTVDATESGWTFVLKGGELSRGTHYLNGRLLTADSSGIRMSGRKNTILVVPS